MRLLSALVVIASGAVLVGVPTAASRSTAEIERRAVLEAAVIRELNRVRADRGLRLLRAAPSLRTAARGHSLAMLEHGFFAHESFDGSDFSSRIRRHYTDRGWMRWSVGEALLSSQSSRVEAREIVAAWLDSPPHRTIVLSPAWRDAGIGVLYAPSAPREYRGAEAIVVTADFGLREGRADY
ncbi:MAG TPA: CAP domain-containing protein [Gaiellaceae bacterium]|nr:CAP domain-containing protein [Gaiellaceae bacterium]